jgi:DNA-binding winged helix-turn-helix (wHTH) protein
VSGDFRVEPWLVKPSLNIISRTGTTARLEPKVMEVLMCLASHAGEALPKEKLLQSVWPDTFVSDDALKHCISEVRQVFEDDAREPHVIQTIPKRGYRLLAPVERVNGSKDTSAASVQQTASARAVPNKRRRWWVGAMAIASVLIPVFLLALRVSGSGGASVVPPIHSLAVLPLQTLSADPAQEYFSDGMTDALNTDLAQIGSVNVISRTSIVRYNKDRESAARNRT